MPITNAILCGGAPADWVYLELPLDKYLLRRNLIQCGGEIEVHTSVLGENPLVKPCEDRGEWIRESFQWTWLRCLWLISKGLIPKGTFFFHPFCRFVKDQEWVFI